jgi:hypothetical protein
MGAAGTQRAGGDSFHSLFVLLEFDLCDGNRPEANDTPGPSTLALFLGDSSA